MPEGDQTSEATRKLPGIPTRRKGGFEMPWDYLQMCTWLLFPLIAAHYFAFIYFLLWDSLAAKVVLTVLFCLFSVSTFTFAGITCTIDPADNMLCQEVQPVYSDPIYCYLCETDVHPTSKHCRYCDKCVVRFDHHCKWLNTCIGEKNYVYFLMIVLSVFLMTTESLTLSIALMIESYIKTDEFMHRIRDQNEFHDFLGSPISDNAVQSLLVVSVFLLLGFVAMLVQLGAFHIMLLYRGMTTYDFIIYEQKRQRDLEAQRLQQEFESQQSQSQRSENGSRRLPSSDQSVSYSTVEEAPSMQEKFVHTPDNGHGGSEIVAVSSIELTATGQV
jgi:palmitoyltransferase